ARPTQRRRWHLAITEPVWFRSRSMTMHPAIGEAAGIGADGSCRSAYTLKTFVSPIGRPVTEATATEATASAGPWPRPLGDHDRGHTDIRLRPSVRSFQ